MKLIDKDALVAEIDKKLAITSYANYGAQRIWAYNDVKEIINTLEVKEVDLEKELEEWIKYGPHTNYPWCTIPDAIKITAEHFFELGLKAQKGEKV